MSRATASRWICLLAALLAVAGCSARESPTDPRLSIRLRWVQGYPGETQARVETGLDWALSFLGAELPKDARIYSWDGKFVTVDLDSAGVLPPSRGAWARVLAAMRDSDEYRKTGGMDIGRFLMLTLCSTPQYYALTDAPASLREFELRHALPSSPAAVAESSIAIGNRLLSVGEAKRMDDIYFVAYEGSGSLAHGTFRKEEIETLDFMPNGQLRFGLYGLDGALKMAATPGLSRAGKPSKCLWCHEIRLQPPFRNVTSVDGYPTAADLRALIAQRMSIVDQERTALKSRIDFSRKGDHTLAELLYLSFEEPSAARLAEEWNLSISQVQEKLAGRKTHAQEEQKILGDQLYHRAEVDRFAPYATLRIPAHSREVGADDPNLLAQGTGGTLP